MSMGMGGPCLLARGRRFLGAHVIPNLETRWAPVRKKFPIRMRGGVRHSEFTIDGAPT